MRPSPRGRASSSPSGLDCVSEDGCAFLGYSAILRWKSASVRYASILVARQGGQVVTRTWLTPCAKPTPAVAGIHWSSRRIGIDGVWRPLAPPIARALPGAGRGCTDWICHQPLSQVRIRLADGVTLLGLGYVEQLTTTVRPWELPIEELRWGRFLSRCEHVVWIDWRGRVPLTLVVRNGAEVGGATVSEDCVDLPGSARLWCSVNLRRNERARRISRAKSPGVCRRLGLWGRLRRRL